MTVTADPAPGSVPGPIGVHYPPATRALRVRLGRDDLIMRGYMAVIALYLFVALALPLAVMLSKSFSTWRFRPGRLRVPGQRRGRGVHDARRHRGRAERAAGRIPPAGPRRDLGQPVTGDELLSRFQLPQSGDVPHARHRRRCGLDRRLRAADRHRLARIRFEHLPPGHAAPLRLVRAAELCPVFLDARALPVDPELGPHRVGRDRHNRDAGLCLRLCAEPQRHALQGPVPRRRHGADPGAVAAAGHRARLHVRQPGFHARSAVRALDLRSQSASSSGRYSSPSRTR